jgi:methionyl aminopeptidase
VTQDCLKAAIAAARAGNRAGDIGAAIQGVAEPRGFSVVREYTSHGVGRELHEGFGMQNFGTAGTGMLLRPGLTLALEPMINEGRYETKMKKDGWTVVTIDGKLSAQFEHTVVITEGDAEILTLV